MTALGRGRRAAGIVARTAAAATRGPLFRWATVTSVDPLLVRWDGPGDPIPLAATLTGVRVGDRVWVLLLGSFQIALGVDTGGDTGWLPLTLADPTEHEWVPDHPGQVRRVGPWVRTRGLVRPVAGAFAGATTTPTLVEFPTDDLNPSPAEYLPAGAASAATYPPTLVVAAAGIAARIPPGGSSYVSLSAAWLTD